MRGKKEVDVVLMVVFLLFFAVVGYYLDYIEENDIPVFSLQKTLSSLNIFPGAKEIEMPKEILSPVIEEKEDKIRIIEIKDTKFNPQELNITVGTIVYWVSKDTHRVYQVYEMSVKQKFNSFRLDPFGSFSYTFEEKGVYMFNDAVFTFMKGRIIVE